MKTLSAFLFIMTILLTTLLPTPSVAEKTAPTVVTIGVISYSTQFLDAQQGLTDGLNQLGLIESKNVRYLVYDLKKDISQIPAIIKTLQNEKCDLILTITTPVTIAVKKELQQTHPIPVIFTMVADPVGSGIVANLQKPGGHITGVSYNAFAMMPKRLELFREALPEIKQIAIFYQHSATWLDKPIQKILYPTATSLNFEISNYDIHSEKDMAAVLKNFDPDIQGIFMVPDPLSIAYFGDLVNLSRQYNLPIMNLDNILISKGGIMGYSPSFYSIGKQAATLANKILNGTPTGNLAIQNPDNVQLVVSLAEANRLGIKLDESFLAHADKIIR
ncbi:MAG: ABC transporter substrate-binding protein [Desulfuromonadales bacterium]|nr:ABC transporter substrate-binding protein [Desulfuromonadales bacterium]